MEVLLRSLVLSWMLGMCCKSYFDTLAEKRTWKVKWMGSTVILGFTLGFLIIAFTRIPPYFLQPVRLILVVGIVAQVYYRIGVVQNLALSVLFCTAFWIVESLAGAVIYALPYPYRVPDVMMEPLVECILLCLVLIFRFRYRKRVNFLSGTRWIRLAYFPIFSMVVIVALNMMVWDTEAVNARLRLVVITGFAVINLFALYFMGSILEKEEEMQRMRLLEERTQNQMSMYQSMQKSYEQQRRQLHDYKNQLSCIQGLLAGGKTEETAEYVARLSGSLRKSADVVNTNHTVVNVVLNQKYRDAWDRGITMTMAVNDLSGLAMGEEDIVTLLVNLLDNGVEACEKLDDNKVIQFKMVLEEDQLILSVRNPVQDPVEIKGKRISSSKGPGHGIGLANVEEVVKRHKGTSILQCKDGWFYFAAMIPR